MVPFLQLSNNNKFFSKHPLRSVSSKECIQWESMCSSHNSKFLCFSYRDFIKKKNFEFEDIEDIDDFLRFPCFFPSSFFPFGCFFSIDVLRRSKSPCAVAAPLGQRKAKLPGVSHGFLPRKPARSLTNTFLVG